MTIHTRTESETSDAGEAFARLLHPGDVVLLYGDLGAGKTAFVRGLARGLGADADEVSSPTFTIIQEYGGAAATLFHVDLYRLEPVEVDDLGLEDLIASGGIVAVEWAERWTARPAEAYEVRIVGATDDARTIDVRNPQSGSDPGLTPV